jgi:hypothetical protein
MFAPHIAYVVEKMTALAGSAAKPTEYRKRAEFPYYSEPNPGT